jgi:hypothetical protein
VEPSNTATAPVNWDRHRLGHDAGERVDGAERGRDLSDGLRLSQAPKSVASETAIPNAMNVPFMAVPSDAAGNEAGVLHGPGTVVVLWYTNDAARQSGQDVHSVDRHLCYRPDVIDPVLVLATSESRWSAGATQ